MTPTRISKPPVKRQPLASSGKGRGSYGRKIMFIVCDDGVEYEISALAAIVGISTSGLYQRIARHGWRHPMILSPRCKPTENLCKKSYLRSTADSGSAEWRAMYSLPRTALLANVRQPGTYEIRQGAGL